MRAVVQRVSRASVSIENKIVGEIQNGLLILLGAGDADAEPDALYLFEKIAGLRVFDDSAGKMNLSLVETNGEILIVSQFTLYGDARRGRRPSYSDAATPEKAAQLYKPISTTHSPPNYRFTNACPQPWRFLWTPTHFVEGRTISYCPLYMRGLR